MFGNNNNLLGLLNGHNHFANFDLFKNSRNMPNFFAGNNRAVTNRLLNRPLHNILKHLSPKRNIDTISLGQNNPLENSISPEQLYTPASLVDALGNLPVNTENQPADQIQPDTGSVEKNFLNMVDLNMDFNLVQFESALTKLIEDAEDGQVEISSYSDVSVGLHVDFNAKAQMEEIYKGIEAENRPEMVESLNVKSAFDRALAMMMKSREFEAEMFYRESFRSHYAMNSEHGDGFVRVSRKLAMQYTQDLSFNFRSLSLYNSQANQLAETGEAGDYIQQTEALVDNPQTTGELIGQFFDTVQGLIDNAEDKTIDKINTFFDNLTAQMGVEPGILDQSRNSLIDGAKAFFSEVDLTMNSLQLKYSENSQPIEQIAETDQTNQTDTPEINEEPAPEMLT